MAYLQVVEMLGDILASLLELAKKWLVEWAVDKKKLLHMLSHIRKEDLFGLIEGTHEIKKKKQLPLKAYYHEYFNLAHSEVITIPDMDLVIAHAIRWEKVVFLGPPSGRFKTGQKKKVMVFRLRKGASAQTCNSFIREHNGSIFPNAHGLSIFEMTVKGVSFPFVSILGMDEYENLSCFGPGSRKIPTMRVTNSKTEYSCVDYSSGKENSGSMLMFFCDPD